MSHEVLISYSKLDKLQADAICNRLESKGIRCWIAPRDVPVGTEYADSIVQALEASEVLLLVYSSNADRSKQVKREVERAVSAGITIMPVRIEDAKMSKSFEYYVGSIHWLDAITPPLESHIDKLAEDLNGLLSRGGEARARKDTQPPSIAQQTTSTAPGLENPAISDEPRTEQPTSPVTQTLSPSQTEQLPQHRGRRPAVIAIAVILLAIIIAIAGYFNMDENTVSLPAEVTDTAPETNEYLDEPKVRDVDPAPRDLDQTSYQSLVALCEQQPAWQWSCEVPAIPYIDPFLDGVCACSDRILLHIETNLFRCEELPPECGGVSFNRTLGYAPEMDWYEDVTP